MYGETYNTSQSLDPKDIFTKDDIRNRQLTLRSSNIVMGNCKGNMSTTHGEGFENRHNESKTLNNQKANSQTKNNFTIGENDKGDFTSMAKSCFKKPHMAESKTKENIENNSKELKSIFISIKLFIINNNRGSL